jgi:5-methylcytosine-specific restriction endonuclease McrA
MIKTDEAMIYPGEVVLFSRWAEKQTDAELLAAVRQFVTLSHHPFLTDTHCGGTANFDSIEAFYAAVEAERVQQVSVARKRVLTVERRQEFKPNRKHLELALIDRDGYVCSHPGCGVLADLTIDHIVPLSRGGTDDLTNLRFLCRSHNSSKGDK